MNKVQQELADFKRILMINAFVKFNLIPPVDSEAWNAHKSWYQGLPLYLLPVSHMKEANEQRLMLLLGTASAAKTPDAKMNLFKELAEVTGFPLAQLACPILQYLNTKFDTLVGRCSFTLYKSNQVQNIPPHLVAGVQEWSHFYDAIPEYYLFDCHHYKAPWTASIIAALLCMELQSTMAEEAVESCLYGLAIALDRHDILTRLEKLEVKPDYIPETSRPHFVQFLITKYPDLRQEKMLAVDEPKKISCCLLM